MIELISSRLKNMKSTLYGHAKRCVKLSLSFWTMYIYIIFGTKLYRHVVGIPMGTNCAPLVADLFLFCYEKDFMMSLSGDKDAEIIEAFTSTSRYFDDLITIGNTYFDDMVNQNYPSELQLNKANSSNTEAPFLELHLTISESFVSSKIHVKHDVLISIL